MKRNLLTFIFPLFLAISSANVFAQTSEVLINQAREAITKQDYPAALAAIESVLKSEPKNDAAMAEKARVLFFQKKITEALALIEKALVVNPKNFVALNLRGIIKHQNNDFAGAVVDFTSAIVANPNFAKAYVNRAKSNERLKVKQDTIIADFLKARELDPKSVAVLKELVNYCLFSTEFKCVAEIDDLMKLSPSADTYYLRGLQAMVKGFGKARLGDDFWIEKAKIAVADIEKAIALDKKVLNSGRNNQNVARIYAHAKNYPVALDYFAKQIAFDEKNGTKNVSAFVLRSEIYMKQGDYESAGKEFDLIEKLDAKVPQIYLGRGQIALQKKDYDNALVQFKKAVEVYPGGESFVNLAFVQAKKKDFANAEVSLKKSYANLTKNSWLRTNEITYCKSRTAEAEIELNKGNSEKAGSLFYQASNEDHDIDKECMANAAYQEGLLKAEKAPLSAMDAFKKANRLDPNRFPDAQGKIDQARERDRQIVAAASNNGGGNSGNQVSNYTNETDVNALKEYYKQAFQKLGISFVKEGTAVNTLTSYRQLTVEATLDAGFVYHFIGICPEKILVSGDGDEYEEYFASGSLGKSSVPQKYGLTTYFYTVAYQGKNSSGAFTFKPTRQKVYWILFRSKRNSQAIADLANDEDIKAIQDTEREERLKYAAAGLTPQQVEALKKMNADEKKVNEVANALTPVWKRRLELEQSFSKLYDKLQSDNKNAGTYAVQMKKDAEEIVRICELFLSKYGTELGKTNLPSLDAKVEVINQQIREMRSEILASKKNIEQLEKIIKGNSQP